MNRINLSLVALIAIGCYQAKPETKYFQVRQHQENQERWLSPSQERERLFRVKCHRCHMDDNPPVRPEGIITTLFQHKGRHFPSAIEDTITKDLALLGKARFRVWIEECPSEDANPDERLTEEERDTVLWVLDDLIDQEERKRRREADKQVREMIRQNTPERLRMAKQLKKTPLLPR